MTEERSVQTYSEMQHGFRNQHGRNCTDVTHADVWWNLIFKHVLNKISENNKENFVKNDDIILTEYVVIYRIYFCSYQVRGKIYFDPNIILYIERTQTNIK